MRVFYLRTIQLFIIVCSNQQGLHSQTLFIPDAQSAGMANVGVATTTASPLCTNPSTMSLMSDIHLGFSYQNNFMVQELNTASAAIAYPGKLGAFGVNIVYFGSSYYNEQKYSLSYSKSLGNKISGGLRFNYFQTDISSEYEKPKAVTGDLGILISPTEHLSIGALVVNLTGARYFQYEYKELKQGFITGAAWTEKQFLITAQAEIYQNQATTLGLGTEIILMEKLNIRLGASTKETSKYTFGIGYGLDILQTDIAFAFHPVLGYSTYITCHIIIGKNRV